MRNVLAVGCLFVILGGCGGDGLSLTEYSDRLQFLASGMAEEFEELDERMSTGSPTVADARDVLSRAVAIRTEFHEGFVALEPPEELADLHTDFVDVHARILRAQEAWAGRAETASSLDELEASTEAVAYGDLTAESVAICDEFQSRLDATADREVFADVPWIPTEMKEVIDVALGC